MICANCALFGSHKGHNISSQDDILLILTDRANDIVNLKYFILDIMMIFIIFASFFKDE